MERWNPPVELSKKEQLLMKRRNRVRALFGFLRTTLPARLGVPVAFAPEQGHLGRTAFKVTDQAQRRLLRFS
jgi:hypothetical protein